MNCVLMHFLKYLLYSNVHFTITSARRTPEQNRACNGVPTSQHLTGEAIDMKPYGSTLIISYVSIFMDIRIIFMYLIN